ncbi:hypothetical protein KSC_001820 [Ktedonobacter sp. SOSP1-52]|uniref:metallopeptidase family protein n=1 Tax=Ktedonobacter sp. SOSP1-52 TaxID=2778366 RepID=UPI001914E26C|nr:metallopeptidase family protein [Ktedonobacter sp. SOSP1-52]GHO61290.1 hypothetical protein KSC_001820 [Ktedonobacter sp. SOSP1-52]
MPTTKSAHSSDDANDLDAPGKNTAWSDKANQQTHTHKNTWKWVVVIVKLLVFLFFGFCSFFVLYITLSRAIDSASALLITSGLVLLLIVGTGYLSKVRSTATHTAKNRPSGNVYEKAQTKKSGNRRTRLKPDVFDQLVQEAVNSIPDEFQKHMDNLAILIEDEPDAETLERVGTGDGHLLLGLYQGVPLASYGSHYSLLPERITIYQRAIEDYCHGDLERILAQVRKTILHEVAHHFGIEHEEMPIWIQ